MQTPENIYYKGEVVTFDEVAHHWVFAERYSSEWSHRYKSLSMDLCPAKQLLQARKGILNDLPLQEIIWYRVHISLETLGACYYLSSPSGGRPLEWSIITNGSNRVIDGALNWEKHPKTQQRVAKAIYELQTNLKWPRIVLLAENRESHLVIIEGCTRATAYVHEKKSPGEVYIGMSERIVSWPFWTIPDLSVL